MKSNQTGQKRESRYPAVPSGALVVKLETMDVVLDKFKEECGIFGIFGHAEASTLTQLGLFALQHRGQEACGIVSSDGVDLHQFRSQGLVSDVLNEEVLSKLVGTSAIGHTRYSTTGKN